MLAQATGKDFGRVKLVFDVTLIVIASALSLLFFFNIASMLIPELRI